MLPAPFLNGIVLLYEIEGLNVRARMIAENGEGIIQTLANITE